jgi:Co/Zn/Cd efflux system component
MKQFVNIAILLSLIMVIATAATAQTMPKQAADPHVALLQQLAVEVTRLKLEVAELSLELQQSKVAELERDLRQLQAEKRKLATHRAELRHEIATIDQHLNLPLETEERSELESRKIMLTEKAPESLRLDEQRLGQREFELYGKLQQAQERLQELKTMKEKFEKMLNPRREVNK